jgi:outer membrane protein TolC
LAALKRTELKSKESLLIENQIIPSLKAALSSFEAQLNAGQGVLLQLWESQRELADVEREALAVWFESRKAHSELRVLLGGEI